MDPGGVSTHKSKTNLIVFCGPCVPMFTVVGDKRTGGRILIRKCRFVTCDRGTKIVRHLLAELHSPLVEGVDAPHDALDERDVLVEGDQLTENRGAKVGGHDRRRRLIAFEDAGRDDGLGGAFRADFVRQLTEGKCLCLREEVTEEQLVLVLTIRRKRICWIGEGNEVGGNQLGTLVDELVEGMLTVRAGLTPEHFTGRGCDGRAIQRTDLPFDSIVSCWR